MGSYPGLNCPGSPWRYSPHRFGKKARIEKAGKPRHFAKLAHFDEGVEIGLNSRFEQRRLARNDLVADIERIGRGRDLGRRLRVLYENRNNVVAIGGSE